MKNTSANGKVRVKYFLHCDEPHAIVSDRGLQTAVYPNSKHEYLYCGSKVETTKCEYPGVFIRVAFFAWVAKNPWRAAGMFALAICAAFFQVTIFALSTPGNPVEEVLQFGIACFSALINISLAIVTFLTVTSGAMWNFGKGVKIQLGEKDEEAILLLPESIADVSPDLLVYAESETDNGIAFALRMAEAQREVTEGQMVIVIPIHSPYVIYFQKVGQYTEERSSQIARNALPHKIGEEIPFEMVNVRRESYNDYMKFVRYFTDGFKEWSEKEKLSGSGHPFMTFQTMLKAAAVSALLFLCPLILSAQNMAKVNAYLGKTRTEIKPRGEVTFTFERKVFTRIGRGDKTYAQLLKSAPGVASFEDTANFGRLVGITVNDQPVEPVETPQVMVSRNDIGEGSAVPVNEDAEQKSLWSSLPDSAQAVEDVYRWKGEAKKAHRKFMFVTFYYWDYFSWWMHQNAFPFLTLALLLFGIPAVASSSEFMVNTFGNSIVGNSFRILHKGSAFGMCVTLIVFAVVVGLDVVIAAITAGWHWAALIALSYVVSRLAGWLIGKIVPNAKIVGNHSSDYFSHNDQKRIG